MRCILSRSGIVRWLVGFLILFLSDPQQVIPDSDIALCMGLLPKVLPIWRRQEHHLENLVVRIGEDLGTHVMTEFAHHLPVSGVSLIGLVVDFLHEHLVDVPPGMADGEADEELP